MSPAAKEVKKTHSNKQITFFLHLQMKHHMSIY